MEELKLQLENMVGSGTSRDVYRLNDTHVIKIPNGSIGFACNLQEYLISSRMPNISVVPSELYFYKTIPVIIMEIVDPKKVSHRELPDDIIDFSDGRQCGKTKCGKVLAYDYGYEFKFYSKKCKSILDFNASEFGNFMEYRPNIFSAPHKNNLKSPQQSLVLV